jgi:probable F420-dependent oxidoreductase
MLRCARRAEELGYSSLWTFQRLLHPATGDWGPMYRSVHDPLVTLAYVAAVTSRIRLGVAVVNMPFYSPVVLAKPLTSLDVVSGGRLDVGLGLGWAREEFTAAGVAYERRGARGADFVQCLQAIWGDNPVSYDGEFFSVPPSLVDPKPVQRPHPPILLGGTAEPALQRAGRYADGWVSSSRHDLTRIGEAVDVIKAAADAAGRDADDLRFVVRGVVSLEPGGSTAADRRPLTGSADQIRGDLDELARHGITDVFFDPNFDPRIGSPDADPAEATDRADDLLETLAPSA